MKDERAITKIQAAIIIVVVAVVGVLSYYLMLPALTPTPTLPAKDKVIIGVSLSLSGIYSPGANAHSLPTFKMIVDDYNAKGGLYIPEYGKRLPIELRIYDDKSDVETMLRLLEKLITEDKVDFLFSPWGTAFTFAAASTFEKYRYPLIAITCSSLQLMEKARTGELKYIFLALTQPPLQAKAAADLLEYVGFKNLGVIYILDLHGIELSSTLYTELYGRGIVPKIIEGYPMGVTDLSPLIRKLKEANIDALFMIGYPEDSVLFIQQIGALGYTPRFLFGSAGMDLPAVMVPLGTDTIKGICHWYGVVSYKENDRLKEFAKKHKELFGFYPESNKAQKYAAHECLFIAIEKYGLDREKVMKALLTEEFDTIIGKVHYEPTKGLIYPDMPIIAQFQGGEMAETIWPTKFASSKWIPRPPYEK
ncbi:MAG: amino acid ABC transporter substrate-binding protein [Candidatus Bathyarchaeia archaeon]